MEVAARPQSCMEGGSPFGYNQLTMLVKITESSCYLKHKITLSVAMARAEAGGGGIAKKNHNQWHVLLFASLQRVVLVDNILSCWRFIACCASSDTFFLIHNIHSWVYPNTLCYHHTSHEKGPWETAHPDNPVTAKFEAITFCQSLRFITVLNSDINEYTTKISKYIIVQTALITVRFPHRIIWIKGQLRCYAHAHLRSFPGSQKHTIWLFLCQLHKFLYIIKPQIYPYCNVNTLQGASVLYLSCKSWLLPLLAGWLTYFVYTSIASL